MHSNEGNTVFGGEDGVQFNEGGSVVGEGIEGVSGVVVVTGEVKSITVDGLGKKGKLTDATLLGRYPPKREGRFLAHVTYPWRMKHIVWWPLTFQWWSLQYRVPFPRLLWPWS